VVFSCQIVRSQERSYTPVFPWISLSIHLGGVKWIIISGKDFDRPEWIKRFLHICNYVEELLWLWNQKYSCCITQMCFHELTIFKECLIMVSKAMQLLATLSLCISIKHGAIAYQICNFNFLRQPWCVSCLSSQELFTNIPSMSWPWDTRSSRRSIIPELFPLSFSTTSRQLVPLHGLEFL
jgi:hypothetical protein